MERPKYKALPGSDAGIRRLQQFIHNEKYEIITVRILPVIAPAMPALFGEKGCKILNEWRLVSGYR